MTAWRVAPSLDELLSQLDALAPDRSRRSDGSIGDAAHASRASDHNPWWSLAGQAYVTARDFTHDPAGGLNCQLLAGALTRARDQRVKYVIWNRQIMSGAGGPDPWVWRPYGGSNPHSAHLHLSVVADARSLVRIPWQLPTLLPAVPAAVPVEDDVSWTHDQGAPAVPDLYRDGLPPLVDPLWALANATAHAAHARDAAAAAVDAVAELRTEVRASLARVVPAPEIDYRRLAAELLAGLGRVQA